MRWLVAIGLCFAFPATGAEVLRVGTSQQILAVSQDERGGWRPGDRVCVFEERQELECGEITRVTGKMVIVKLDSPNDRVARGSRVRSETKKNASTRLGRNVPPQAQAPSARDPRDDIEEPEELLSPPPDVVNERKNRGESRVESRPDNRGERRPAAKLLTSYDKVEGVSSPDWNFSGGVSAGFTFFFPMIHFQRLLSPYVALGIMPVYFKSSASAASVGAYGGVLTINYYGNEYFRGFWLQVGGGLYQFSATDGTAEESSASAAFLTTVGWRGYWDLGLNVGVGAGLQYVTDPKFALTEVKAVNIQPLIVLDVGISF